MLRSDSSVHEVRYEEGKMVSMQESSSEKVYVTFSDAFILVGLCHF